MQPAVVVAALAADTLLAGGRYRLGRVLGQGGFGITYQGSDTLLGRKVAIKELFPDGALRQGRQIFPPAMLGVAGFAQAKARFLDEARLLAQFNHPSIVRVWDLFEEQSAYIVMEFLEGRTLGERMAGGPLPSQEVEQLAQPLLQALAVVHAAGQLHRDLKPDNVFLTNDGRVVLIDFGAARGFNAQGPSQQTRIVTPGYAPLEQYAAQANVSPATDLYALAATLWHALSGQMPPAATDRVMGAALPPLPASTPAKLRQALSAALEMKILARPQSAQAFAQLLGPASNSTVNQTPAMSPAPTPAMSPAPTPAASRPARQWRRLTLAARHLAFNPSGSLLVLVTGETAAQMLVLDRPASALPEPIGLHFGGLTHAAWAGEHLLVTAGKDKAVRAYDVRTGREQWRVTDFTVPIVALAAQNGSIAVGLANNSAQTLDQRGQKLQQYVNLQPQALIFTDTGQAFYSGSGSDQISRWDVASGRLLARFTGPPEPLVALALPQKDLLVAASAWFLRLMPLDGRPGRNLPAHSAPITALAGHGKGFISGYRDGTVFLWDSAGVQGEKIELAATVEAIACSNKHIAIASQTSSSQTVQIGGL
jgi:serine/threonine protein kinase